MGDKKFNIVFDVNANTSQAQQKFNSVFNDMKRDVEGTQKEFNKLQAVLENIEIPPKFKKGLEGITSQIESEIKNFKSLTENGLNSLGDSKKAEQSVNKISELYRKLKIEINDISGIDIEKLLPKEFVARVKTATDSWNKFVKVYNDIGKENQAIQDTNDKLKEQAKIVDELQQKQKNYKPSDNSELNKQRFAEAQHQKSLEKQQHDIAIERDRISKDRSYKTKLERQDDIKKLENDYKSLGEQIEESKRKQAEFTKQIEENKKIGENLDKAKQEYAELEKQLRQLTEAAQAGKIEEFRESLAQALNLPNKEELPKTFEELQTYINNLEVDQAQKITEQLKQLGPAAESGAKAVGKLKESTDKAGEGFRELSQREKEIEQFANRIKYFFSIGNTVMLFRRAINSAIETVKELDEVMTQAAVVTRFTVADMWAQLPQYAQRANELGVTIKGVYEASTLYYQQGLDTIEVIGVANETLKMAKIAGIDYATATDYMTSALRGFNMEVNELSAQKVNDIYSQLAAKTASNVQEISVAMSKTAPLAHNAGMEIETTAALLAQMIERTREAPETLGTAMKTVIARFQELKKDPALIEPVEGEIVDANKIETALRTIGVSLRDTSGQFRNLDEVFLEISEKWDGLSTNTQRYIATIAAGSRQQSRFIAMMADYKRTMELVGLANNAAGASEEQFAKTQDSLQSKLNRLKNAWDEFTMGLANNKVIKAVVDLLAGFINLVNKLTKTLSFGSGLLKSFWDVGALLLGIKLGRAAFNGFFGWLLKTSKVEALKAGTAAGTGFGTGLKGSLTTLKSFLNKTIPANVENLKKTFSTALNSGIIGDLDSPISEEMFSNAATATQAYRLELEKVGKTLSLTSEQQKISNLLQQQGVTVGIANAAAVSGLTEEEIAEAIATAGGTNADKEAIKKQLEKIAADKSEAIATGKLIASQKLSLGQRIKGNAALLFGSEAARKKAFADLKLAGADVEATAASEAFNASIYACPIGWYVAGIAAIVAILAVLAMQAHAISLDGRMKAAAEATKQAKEAADEAKQSYDDLADAHSGYDETQQALKDLAYGTQEWSDKLAEANQQVLELIQKFPELTKFLKQGEYGQLTIDSAGWDEVIKKQQDLYLTLTGAAIKAQTRESDLELEKTAKDTNYNKYQSQYGEIFTGMEEALLSGSGEEFERLGETLDISDEKLKKVKNSIIDYNSALEESKQVVEKSTQAFFTSVLSPEKIQELGVEALNNLSQTFSQYTKDKYTGENILIPTPSGVAPDQRINSDLMERYSKEIDKIGGINESGDVKALRSMLSALTGKTMKELRKQYGRDIKAMELAIADFANSDETKKQIEEITDRYLSLSEADKEIVDVLTSNGEGYYEGVKEFTDTLSEAGKTFIKDLTGQDYEDFFTEDLKKKGIEQQKTARENLINRNINIGDFGQYMDTGMMQGLSDNLIKVFEASGSEAAEILGAQLSAKFVNLKSQDPEKAKQFMTALNSIDWKKANEVDTLSNKLDELGITANDLGVIDIDNLEDEIKQLAKAAREVDLEKLTNQIRVLGQLAYDIGSGKQTNDFSEEQKNNLVSEGVAKESDFIYDFETGNFKYLGGTMEDLRQAIIENTKVKVEEQKEAINDKIEAAEVAKNIISENPEESDFGLILKYIQSGQSDKNMEWVQQVLKEKGTSDNDTFKEYANEIKGQANELPQLQDQSVAIDQQAIINELIVEYQDNLEKLATKATLTSEDTEAAARALKVLALNAGVAEEQIKDLNAAEIAEITSTYRAAKAHDVDVKELQEYANNLKTVNKNLKSSQAAQVALANTLLNKGLKKIIDGYEDWTKLIDESTGKIKRSTSEDAKAYEELKSGVSDMLNISPELSEKLLDNANNIDLVRQAAEGSKEALAELQVIAAQEYLLTIKGQVETTEAEQAIDNFISYLNSVDLPPLEPGVDLSDVWAGTASFIDACNTMITTAGLTGDQITQLFDGLGFTTELTTVTKRVDLLKNLETGSGEQLNLLPDEIKALKKTTITQEYTLPTVRIKSLKSNGNAGGGVSNNVSYAGGGGSSGGGGGGSSSDDKTWENPYDWLYNLTQKINAELRTREKLERRYQRLLKTYSGTGEDLKKIADQELASLEKRKQYEQEMIKLRRQELKEYLAANAALAKYAQIDWDLEVVRIDWNQINAVTDPEEGEAIEKYIDKLEELIQSIRDAEDAIDDIDDEIIDLKQRGRDQYRDLEDRVLDALISEQQEMIDEQERIYDAINDAASDLMDAISRNIEKIRQDRQNEETETSLAEKERRLAYLRQDTTGSNALEIKKLEEDLDKEKQNYTDALIDQSLNDLKEQNDHAAEQREKQIELMQSTLDWQQQTGYWVDEATRIVREGIGPNGMLTEDSELYRLLFEQEHVASMSNASQAWWLDNLKNTVAQAYLYLENALKPAETGATSSVSDRDIMADIRAQAATGRANNSGMDKLNELENERNAKIDRLGVEDTWNKTRMVENYNKGYNEYNNSTDGKTDWMAKINEELAKETPVWDNAFYYAGKRDAKLKTLNDSGASSIYSSDFTFEIVLEKWYEATKSHTYKTGGLADFTGPAWLDGSKSKPEMVLNARDTENFLQLKDILSNLRMSFSGSKGALGGDWYFDIDINVGEIASDYDVDQLTERVKQSIYTESTYRNVNAINFLK